MTLLPILPELSNAVQMANSGNFLGASLSVDIVVGIVSGILTTALIFGFVQLFKRIVVPWYQALIYRGLDISGEWIWDVSGKPQRAVFNLEQKANRLTGLGTFIKRPPPPTTTAPNVQGADSDLLFEDIRIFIVKGQVFERFVLLEMTHADKKRLGIALYLLELTGDGRQMRGRSAAYTTAGVISGDDCVLRRKTG